MAYIIFLSDSSMKGQSALEYLTTYGWAILIVIIAGAALYALGVFNPSVQLRARNTGFEMFYISDFSLSKYNDTNTVLALRFSSRAINPVNMTGVCWDVDEIHYHGCPLAEGVDEGFKLSQGEEYLAGGDLFPYMAPRSQYTFHMAINYTDMKTGMTHGDFGIVRGTVEEAITIPPS